MPGRAPRARGPKSSRGPWSPREVFAAEGTDAAGEREVGQLAVSVDVTEDDEVAGLLRATIVVRDAEGAEVYRLETARAGGEEL